MDFATFLKIQNLQQEVLVGVHQQADNLLQNFDTMSPDEFLQTLLSFAMDISALASTLTTEAIVGSEAMVKISEELEELRQIAIIVEQTS